jgi:glycosyltransferase involved in cell wall biosynthesis
MKDLYKKLGLNSEPWDIPFWDRLEALKKENTKKKIAYIYEKADTSTFRYRAYNMCQSLEESKEYTGVYFFEYELGMLADYFELIDLVIFARTRWSLPIDEFNQKAKKHGIKTLFDMDDLVFDIQKLPLVMSTLNVDFKDIHAYDFWFAYASRLWIMGQICDGTIGTNKYICDRLEDYYHKPSYIVDNFLNKEQIAISEYLFSQKESKGRMQEVKKIGYFSGTPSHINDFKKVAPELEELLKKYPKLSVEVVGFMEFPDYLMDFYHEGRITHTPLVDFLTLQERIADSDINVIPLLDNEFTNCKSELKFFEAAIVGTVTFATPTYVYKENIKEGETGFLCRESEWAKKIGELVETGIKKELIDSARDYCLEKYSPQKQLKHIEAMLSKQFK